MRQSMICCGSKLWNANEYASGIGSRPADKSDVGSIGFERLLAGIFVAMRDWVGEVWRQLVQATTGVRYYPAIAVTSSTARPGLPELSAGSAPESWRCHARLVK